MMKARSNQRGKSKNPKSFENKPPVMSSKQRAQSLPPPESALLPSNEEEIRRHSDQPILSKKDLASLRKAICLQDSTNTSHQRKTQKVPLYYGCPVEVLSPRCLTVEEKTALVQEMNQEFLNTRKVFISGLPSDSTKETLVGFFSEFNCVPVTPVKDRSVRVLFPSHEAAVGAIAMLHATSINCHYLMATQTSPDSLLFVGNLPLTYTRQDLSFLFAPYGEILRSLVVYSPETGRNKGYGFVEYMHKEEAVLAKQQMATKVVGLRSLRVDFADHGMQRVEDLQSETLFVDRLPKGFQDEETLKEKFSNYGTVNFCQVAVGVGGASRGFAFVDMGSSEEAERAQLACNGCSFAGQEMRVSFGMPCRRGACILQHKPNKPSRKNVGQFLAALPCHEYSLKGVDPYLGNWRRGTIFHAKSEESLQLKPTKPRPLIDATNMQSDPALFGCMKKAESLTHLFEPALLQHGCMCHSASTPNICTHISGKFHYNPPHQLDAMEPDMDEGDNAHHHSHAHSQEAMPLQDRACPAPPPQQQLHPHQQHQHYLPTTTSSKTFTPMALTTTHSLAPPTPSQPTAPITTTSTTSSFPSPPLAHSTLLGTEAQLETLDEEENPIPEIKPSQRQAPALPPVLPLALPSAMPVALLAPGVQHQHSNTHKGIVDTVLGKRQSPHLLEQWGCGSLDWGCGEEGGVYEQLQMGQHLQGLPFIHPLKRIRMMELC